MDHLAAPQGWDSGQADSFNFNDPQYIDLFEEAYFELFERLPPPGTHIWADLVVPEPAKEARTNQLNTAYTHLSSGYILLAEVSVCIGGPSVPAALAPWSP